jgi:hypothetical protein
MGDRIPIVSTRLEIDAVHLNVQTALFAWLDANNEEIKAHICAHFATLDIISMIEREVDVQLRDSIKRGVENALKYNSFVADQLSDQVSMAILAKFKERES